jgi:putative Holliday junction resolvase
LAIDYGTKRTGLSSYCPGKDPYPLLYGKILYKNDQQLCLDLSKIIENEVIDVLILGLPKYLDGNSSEMTKRVESFGTLLKETFQKIEFHYQDERLTSYEAEERMKSSPRYNFKVDENELDALSASIILEDFIKTPLF